MNKSFTYLLILVGGAIGSYIPVLVGQDPFSVVSIAGGFFGSLAGIWAAFKINSLFY